MPSLDWALYRQGSGARTLSPFVRDLERFLPANRGTALDLGCGTGTEALWLAEQGFEVEAIECDPATVAALRATVAGCERVHVLERSFLEGELAEYDLVLALYSVFFVPPADFARLWPRIVSSIKPRGVFAGQLLGVRDDWAGLQTTAHTRAEIEGLFQGFRLLSFDEVEEDGATEWGEPKHWHLFHIVAVRP